MNFPAIIVIVVIGCLILWPFIICCRIKIFKEQAALKTALTKLEWNVTQGPTRHTYCVQEHRYVQELDNN